MRGVRVRLSRRSIDRGGSTLNGFEDRRVFCFFVEGQAKVQLGEPFEARKMNMLLVKRLLEVVVNLHVVE